MQALKGIISAMFMGTLLLAAPAMHADDRMDRGQGHGHWDKFDMLKKQLGLTDEQVSQWKESEKGQKQEMKLLGDEAKADLAELVVQVDQKASDTVLEASLKTLMADHKAMQASTEKQMDTLREILTPMQQAKLVVMMFGHHRRGEAYGGGWGDHGPRGGWQGAQGAAQGPDGDEGQAEIGQTAPDNM
jgi:Spy/CpxP family protein refolding chaperone